MLPQAQTQSVNIFLHHYISEFFFLPTKFIEPCLDHVRISICAGSGTQYSVPRDLQKQDRVTARFSCFSTPKFQKKKKKKKKIGHFTKF